MPEVSSGPGSAPSAGGTDGEATRTALGRDQVSRPQLDDAASTSAQAPTETALPHAPTDVVRHGPGVPVTVAAGQAGQTPERAGRIGQAPEIVRHGPGVPAARPAGQAELTAERVWHASGGPGRPSRRRARLGRLAGWALTVILLAASGVALYLRFHHAPFRVTGVAITQQAHNGCGVEVTGRITTNGSAGTVSYQWLLPPDRQPPQPLSQSAVAGQRAVYVTVAVAGQGHGSASQLVTLQVLGPDPETASAGVVISCP
jgi:hypothetical protein